MGIYFRRYLCTYRRRKFPPKRCKFTPVAVVVLGVRGAHGLRDPDAKQVLVAEIGQRVNRLREHYAERTRITCEYA
jgi:hypothetical protein